MIHQTISPLISLKMCSAYMIIDYCIYIININDIYVLCPYCNG